MYVPGDDTRKLNKAFNLDVDCVAMDCEDGVALNQKVSHIHLNNECPIVIRVGNC